MKTIYRFLILGLIFSIFSCEITNNDVKPEENVYKILNNNSFEKTFFAKQLIQTDDDGYLVLGSNYEDASNYVWLTPYLVKLNAKGEIVWETELPSPYVNPIGIWKSNLTYHIACMNETTLGTHILSISETNGTVDNAITFGEIIYPLAMTKTPDGGIAIEGYERNTRRTTLTKFNSSLQIEWTQKYPLNEDSEELVIAHISKKGKQYPFFVGYSGENTVENYYINGFYQYTFALIFADASGNFSGVLNGFRFETAVSSAVHNSASEYFLSMWENGTNYLMPNVTLSAQATASVKDIDKTVIPNLEEDAVVINKKMNINETECVVYASNSKNNQILFYIFDAANGNLITQKEISDYYPIEINDIIQTKDKGIAIIGQTYVSGRFARIFFLKLSEESFWLSE